MGRITDYLLSKLPADEAKQLKNELDEQQTKNDNQEKQNERTIRNHDWIGRAHNHFHAHHTKTAISKTALRDLRTTHPIDTTDYADELGNPENWAANVIAEATRTGQKVADAGTPGLAPIIVTGAFITITTAALWIASIIGVGWSGDVSVIAAFCMALHALILFGALITAGGKNTPSGRFIPWIFLGPITYLAFAGTANQDLITPLTVPSYALLIATGISIATTTLTCLTLTLTYRALATTSDHWWLRFARWGMIDHGVLDPKERRQHLTDALHRLTKTNTPPTELHQRFGTPSEFHAHHHDLLSRLPERPEEPSENLALIFVLLVPVATLTLALLMVLAPTGGAEIAIASIATLLVLFQIFKSTGG